MLKQIKQKTEIYLTPYVAHLPIDPNTITIVSIIPSLLFLIALVYHAYALALLALLGTLLDGLDGIVARAQNKASAFGGFLDSTMDRLSDALIIVSFGFGGLVAWEIIVIVLSFSFLISYARSRGELASGGQVKFNVGLIERPQRLISIFFALVLYLFFPSRVIGDYNIIESIFLLLILFSLYTFLQRVFFAYTHLKN